MRILMVTGSASPMNCGVGDYTIHLSKYLSDLAEVHVLTSHGAYPKDDKTFKVIPLIKKWDMRYIFDLVKAIKRIKPNVINIQYPTQGYTGWLAFFVPLIGYFLKIPVVQTWHEIYQIRHLKYLLVNGWVPGGLVIVRPRYLELTHPIVRFLTKNKIVKFIPNGSTIPQSKLEAAEVNKMRARLLEGQSRLLIFFGFIYPHKGLETIFEVAMPTRDRILIIGAVNKEDPYHLRIMELANKAPWRGKVTFLDFLPPEDVANLLRCSDVALFPMRNGAGEWNTSIQAATKNLCPSVATTIDQPQIIGLVNYVPINNNTLFRVALEHTLQMHPFEKRNTLSSVSSNEWLSIAQQHLDLYRQLIRQPQDTLCSSNETVNELQHPLV